MKKIIPFNNILNFNTDVREITAISLEHEIKKYPDMISGVFYISGEYKMTDGQLEKEKFNFELPFDIALSNKYNLETLLIDIDDFRYDMISDKELKVNIDLYIDGEEIELPEERNIYTEELPEEPKDIINLQEEIISIMKEENNEEEVNESSFEKTVEKNELKEDLNTKESEDNTTIELLEEPKRNDLLQDMLATNIKEEKVNEDSNSNNININNNDNSNNIIYNQEQEEEYVTYRVYKVVENDTLDTILTKYNITKEMLSDYNDIENIIPGDKLIIPTNEK